MHRKVAKATLIRFVERSNKYIPECHLRISIVTSRVTRVFAFSFSVNEKYFCYAFIIGSFHIFYKICGHKYSM